MKSETVGREQAEMEWPEGGLERVCICPICGACGRNLLHEGLTDTTFFAAPGKWSLWQCNGCQSAYLDPRPNQATIGLAYAKYYTHEDVIHALPRSSFQRVRAALANGYRNSRFGTRLHPANRIGVFLAALIPPLRWPIDVAYRFLPKRSPDRSVSVLDIGCGNGTWLEVARDAGWHVAGVEPDPVAREEALKHGIEVRPSLTDWFEHLERFDYVTISHVIEHVHEPLELLRNSYALLRPGGGIYIETPNINSMGHQFYGANWRGLEPPRHLVLFNDASLIKSVEKGGFYSARLRLRLNPIKGMSEQSRNIAAGLRPASTVPHPGFLPTMRAAFEPRRWEFLSVTAVKPK